jgi:hypothetical protein
MSDSPSSVDFKQLRELYVRSVAKEKKTDEQDAPNS